MDWRKHFVICEHLVANPDLPKQRNGSRVCCMECFEDGFLFEEDFVVGEQGGFTVGRIDPDLKAHPMNMG